MLIPHRVLIIVAQLSNRPRCCFWLEPKVSIAMPGRSIFFSEQSMVPWHVELIGYITASKDSLIQGLPENITNQ